MKDANDLMDFAVEVMRAASAENAVVMMTFPEDLGPSKLGSPVSIWQREDVRQLEAAGLHRYAVYQGDWCSMVFNGPFASHRRYDKRHKA